MAERAAVNDELAGALSAVLEAYLAQAGGGMVTSFVLVADVIDSDGEERWLWATSPGQKTVTTAGLKEWLAEVVHYEAQRHLREQWGGDE